MNIRQEESTPIGDYFHDSGICSMFKKLTDIVDEFDVETDDVIMYCDGLINALKGLKAQTKKAEQAYQKLVAQKRLVEESKVIL